MLLLSVWLFASDLPPLIEAARDGNLQKVKELVKSGVYVDVESENAETALMYAAYNGHIQVVIFLVNHGADLNMRNFDCDTPLDWAIQGGHKKVIEYLYAAGARPNNESIKKEQEEIKKFEKEE